MARSPSLSVPGTPEVDVDRIPDGQALAVSTPGPVQGDYKVGVVYKKEYTFDVLNQATGELRQQLVIKQH